MKSKLKFPASLRWQIAIVLIIGIVYLAATILEGELFGTHYTQWVWGLILIGAGFYFYLKFNYLPQTERLILLVSCFVVGLGAWHYELAKHHETVFSEQTFNLHLVFMALFFVAAIPILFLRKKLTEAYSRQIFELAAQSVQDAKEGFTTRPFPAGKVTVQKKEILSFARFLSKNRIAVPNIDEERVKISFSTLKHPGALAKSAQSSYVAIDYEGNVSVFIDKLDYEQYKDALTFDQLCRAMGDLFKELITYYKNGQRDKILKYLEAESLSGYKKVTLGIGLFGLLLFVALVILFVFKLG